MVKLFVGCDLAVGSGERRDQAGAVRGGTDLEIGKRIRRVAFCTMRILKRAVYIRIACSRAAGVVGNCIA